MSDRLWGEGEGRGGNRKRGEEEEGREERRQCWNGHKHVVEAHRGSKHSYTESTISNL